MRSTAFVLSIPAFGVRSFGVRRSLPKSGHTHRVSIPAFVRSAFGPKKWSHTQGIPFVLSIPAFGARSFVVRTA